MNFIPPTPPGGKGNLRRLMNEINEDQKILDSDPRYMEGWDDGYLAAKKEYKKLFTALSAVYQIGDRP